MMTQIIELVLCRTQISANVKRHPLDVICDYQSSYRGLSIQLAIRVAIVATVRNLTNDL